MRKNEWECDPINFKVAVLAFLLLVGCTVFVKQPASSSECITDSDCAEKFGYNGDPEPMENIYVCIHTDHNPPCKH